MTGKRIWMVAILLMAALVLTACPQAAPAQPSGEQPAAEQPAKEEAKEEMAAEEAPAEEAMEGEKEGMMSWEDVDPTGQEITFWHQHSRAREEALQQIVADFNANNEWGITVNAEYQGGYGDIFNKMLNVLNTPDAPNLVVAYQNQAATYQLADALVDMNPLVNSPKWGLSEDELNDFFPAFLKADVFPTFGGARLGWPPNRSMEVMYYNEEWLAELGFDGPPTTPDQFKEMACKAAQQPFSKATAEGSIGYELSIDASRFASWTFAFGGDVFDYEANQYAYNSPEAIAAMEFIQSLFNDGCATVVAERYGDQTDFGNGVTLFTVGSSSGLPFYRGAVEEGANFAWSVDALPHVTPDPVMNLYGASISIPKTTPEKELAAWLFLKYFTSPDVQATWVKASNYFPVRKSVAENLSDYFEENPQYAKAFGLLPYAKTEPPVPGYDFVRDLVREAMAAIADGADIQSTLDQLNQEANDILADQLAQ